jgi:hypothetical protein
MYIFNIKDKLDIIGNNTNMRNTLLLEKINSYIQDNLQGQRIF